MDPANLNSLLFGGKWALIGLVYLVLVVILIAVRREMVSHSREPERPSAVAAGRLKVIQAGSDRRISPGKFLPLKPETRLGAEVDNDIILDDQFVSRYHAHLRWDGAVWWIEDVGSSNGTTVDGKICPPRVPQPLQNGASLKMGDMVFELVA
jgi:hypothetical protein